MGLQVQIIIILDYQFIPTARCKYERLRFILVTNN